ncbi:hypothetical protein D0Z06_22915 [Geodermatophilus marinus]|nr:hypothetical protein D0Z06_22915 [Geodermatophilus sp. LHW52908]
MLAGDGGPRHAQVTRWSEGTLGTGARRRLKASDRSRTVTGTTTAPALPCAREGGGPGRSRPPGKSGRRRERFGGQASEAGRPRCRGSPRACEWRGAAAAPSRGSPRAREGRGGRGPFRRPPPSARPGPAAAGRRA